MPSAELIGRARAGDETARAELARLYPKKAKQSRAPTVTPLSAESLELRERAARASDSFSRERRAWYRSRWGFAMDWSVETGQELFENAVAVPDDEC